MSSIRVLSFLRLVYLNLNLIDPPVAQAIQPDQWIQKTAFEYAQILAAASSSLRRISLRANEVVVPFTVERDDDSRVVSISQKREV